MQIYTKFYSIAFAGIQILGCTNIKTIKESNIVFYINKTCLTWNKLLNKRHLEIINNKSYFYLQY